MQQHSTAWPGEGMQVVGRQQPDGLGDNVRPASTSEAIAYRSWTTSYSGQNLLSKFLNCSRSQGALGGRYFLPSRIDLAGGIQGAAEGFEEGLGLMMVVTAVEHARVNVEPAVD